MDRPLVYRLRYDKDLGRKLSKLVRDYITLGFRNVDYWAQEWDAIHDIVMGHAVMAKKDHEALDRGNPKRFILPMTSTQISTMTAYLAQVLYGDQAPHRIEGRGPEDEVPAEHLNALLKWNVEQQPTFLKGYLFIHDALVFNRGIFYNSWGAVVRPEVKEVEVEMPGEFDADGNPVKYMSIRSTPKTIAGFCKMELVSPYDWCCDPGLPLHRAQEGRFMAHRFKVAWTELDRRSRLREDEPAYVRPEAVELLKKKKKRTGLLTGSLDGRGMPGGPAAGSTMSRTFYERTRVNAPAGTDTADNQDPGIVDCVELWVRLVPSDYGIYDSHEPTTFQIVVAADEVILSMEESAYAHGQFPYSYAEARPFGHSQFSPSWAWSLKGLQDHIDFLKNRHQEAVQRTVGNIFVYNPTDVDVEDFLNPDKEGLMIALKPSASGKNIDQVFKQIPIKDLTENFMVEMRGFVDYAQSVAGANSYMQGAPGTTDESATAYAGTQQMAAGRMASIARLLSTQALVPQTQQFVSMFQQFLTETQKVRFVADPFNTPPELRNVPVLNVDRDTIQGAFDFVAHDGALPNGDTKRVAAISTLLKAGAAFPQAFVPGPGNIDPRALIIAGAKATGLPNVEQFFYADMGAGAAGMVAGQVAGEVPGASGIPGNTPGPAPATPSVAVPEAPSVAPAAPSQPRP